MTERDTIDTPEDRALSRAIFKKIDETAKPASLGDG